MYRHEPLTRPRAPDALELRYSRPWAAAGAILFTAWTVYLGYGSFVLQHVITAPLAALLFAPIAAFCLWRIASSVRRLLRDAPVVTLDEAGITDIRRGDTTVQWLDIADVRIGPVRGGMGLVVRFRNRHVAREHLGTIGMLGGFIDRYYSSGEWPIRLTSLRYDRDEVLRTAKAFLVYTRAEARAALAQ